MPCLSPVSAEEVDAVADFLRGIDLTVSGLDSCSIRLWVERNEAGTIVGSTGFELSANSEQALIRSVGVDPARRGTGTGTRLASFALDEAARAGAHTAWLFSRRSGPFWQSLGFRLADRMELARVLANAHQVVSFSESGQLDQEVAWARPLSGAATPQNAI